MNCWATGCCASDVVRATEIFMTFRGLASLDKRAVSPAADSQGKVVDQYCVPDVAVQQEVAYAALQRGWNLSRMLACSEISTSWLTSLVQSW